MHEFNKIKIIKIWFLLHRVYHLAKGQRYVNKKCSKGLILCATIKVCMYRAGLKGGSHLAGMTHTERGGVSLHMQSES